MTISAATTTSHCQNANSFAMIHHTDTSAGWFVQFALVFRNLTITTMQFWYMMPIRTEHRDDASAVNVSCLFLTYTPSIHLHICLMDYLFLFHFCVLIYGLPSVWMGTFICQIMYHMYIRWVLLLLRQHTTTNLDKLS